LIRDFAEEHSMLHELAARIAERPVLVTFNGKTFDWPLLESRFTMTRAIATPKLTAHLDLLHPSRALWRLRLGSVRLVELERRVLDAARLGWRREEDVLSAMIPQYYFDYLRGGPATRLIGIVRHNQMDLRGLAALVGKIDELLAAEHPSAQDFNSVDLLGLSKFLHRKGDRDRAQAACAHAMDRGLPIELRPQARRDLAQFAKRRGDHAEALTHWHDLAADQTADDANAIHACEQLAIHYERHAKDFARALEFTRLALKKLDREPISPHNPYATTRTIRCEQRLQKRLTRLKLRVSFKDAVCPLLTTDTD
jgi:hypothetical protein